MRCASDRIQVHHDPNLHVLKARDTNRHGPVIEMRRISLDHTAP
jgi:hypothetical protein